MFPNKFSIFSITVISAILFNQAESLNLSWPTMPAIRSFLWTRPSDNAEDLVQAHVAQTQAQVAQTNNVISDQVRRIQDNIGNRVADMNRAVVDYTSNTPPGTQRKLIVTDNGLTEEMTASFVSPDGNSRGFAKSARTVYTNNKR